MKITIRNEQAADINAITRLIESAFEKEKHSSHTEQFIVNALRYDDQLTVSLISIKNELIMRHVAISPVKFSSGTKEWYDLCCAGKPVLPRAAGFHFVDCENRLTRRLFYVYWQCCLVYLYVV